MSARWPASELTFWEPPGRSPESMHLMRPLGSHPARRRPFQGHRADAHELNANLPFDARRVDGIVLSHAHIDQQRGGCPLLVRRGFHGPSTPRRPTATCPRSCCSIAAHIQERTSSFSKPAARPLLPASRFTNRADAIAVPGVDDRPPLPAPVHLRKHSRWSSPTRGTPGVGVRGICGSPTPRRIGSCSRGNRPAGLRSSESGPARGTYRHTHRGNPPMPIGSNER